MQRNQVVILLICFCVFAFGGVSLLQAQPAQPVLHPSAVCGFPGDRVSVEGLGFTPEALLAGSWSGMALGTTPARVQVDPIGRVQFSFIAPTARPARILCG